MKPCELFPGAVTAQGVVADALCDSVVLTDGRTELYDSIAPLPISPAVLRGFGLRKSPSGRNTYLFEDRELVKSYEHEDGTFYAIRKSGRGMNITSTHQLQALALHLYGVELTWNQDEYETALKEEAK